MSEETKLVLKFGGVILVGSIIGLYLRELAVKKLSKKQD